jgi:hypothetical protein
VSLANFAKATHGCVTLVTLPYPGTKRGNCRVSDLPEKSGRMLERDFQRRCVHWATGSAVLWAIWALTGMPTGAPRVVGSEAGWYATPGLWPALVTLVGLPGLARRAWELYAGDRSVLRD